MKSIRKGFTLVELMVVIVIIGILAALAIPRFLGATNKTKASEFKPVLKQVYTLQTAYKQERDQYAATLPEISFDAPDAATSRFTYASVVVAGTPNTLTNGKLASATVVAGGKIKGVLNQDLAGVMACVDTSAVQTAQDGLYQLANVPSTASCP